MATYNKLPAEVFDIYKDFSAPLGSDTIQSIVAVTSINERTGLDSTADIVATSPPPSISGSKVFYWVKGGAVSEQHKVTITIATAGGREFSDVDHIVVWSGA